MRMRVFAAAMLAGMLAGCCSTHVTTEQPAYGIPVDDTSNQFLWGLVSGRVHTSGHMSRVEVYKSFGDYILTFITLGIYTPWSVNIWYSETTNK